MYQSRIFVAMVLMLVSVRGGAKHVSGDRQS